MFGTVDFMNMFVESVSLPLEGSVAPNSGRLTLAKVVNMLGHALIQVRHPLGWVTYGVALLVHEVH